MLASCAQGTRTTERTVPVWYCEFSPWHLSILWTLIIYRTKSLSPSPSLTSIPSPFPPKWGPLTIHAPRAFPASFSAEATPSIWNTHSILLHRLITSDSSLKAQLKYPRSLPGNLLWMPRTEHVPFLLGSSPAPCTSVITFGARLSHGT